MAYVQKSTAQDWPVIKRIIETSFEIFGEDEPQNITKLAKQLLNLPEADDAISLIATMQGQTCGYILLFPTHHEGQLYYILSLIGVLPAFQKKAVGSHLIQSAINDLPKECVGIFVLGDEYYTRFGFKPCKDYNLVQPFPNSENDQYFLMRQGFVKPDVPTIISYPAPFHAA
ncbi:MAG: GNAT family N-acetyltransferase [Alphaproteobacteria bacterium]